MATVVLTSLGSLFGGPLGGALGALVGRQVDGAIFGGPKNEGPRLKDRAVSTSSYGQPIARHYGQVRAAGTIFWATELKESREKSGGGKGRPSTTTYNYSVSFAVALSSGPIDRLGRVWADSNLLRGAGGDLKTAGTLRVHLGHADQSADPLLAAALGEECPAHRGMAYAVFEDLSLADFGNRIPALSFEIFAGDAADLVDRLVEPIAAATGSARIGELKGYSYDGGTLGGVLSQVDRINPITPRLVGPRLAVAVSDHSPETAVRLPEPASWKDGEFGRQDGRARARRAGPSGPLAALRYYDADRDYLPGLQRTEVSGDPLHHGTMEFPGVLGAGDARVLLRAAATRESVSQETLAWRMATLDPALQPGVLVRAPGIPGTWRVAEWEWREGGIELQLVRQLNTSQLSEMPASPGAGWLPPDRQPQPSLMRAFELPWDGSGSSENRRVFVAAGAAAGPWSGAALYARQGTTLARLGHTGGLRATGGVLLDAMSGSNALRFEPDARLTVQLHDHDAVLEPSNLEDIARGANRLLVAGEILQFAAIEPLGAGKWELTGLLRGRGGTEAAARAGHPAGAAVTLIDDQLLALDPARQGMAGSTALAAIGLADSAPVEAPIENPGASRRPLTPCHPQAFPSATGGLCLAWTRRARGHWTWLDEVEQPLVEQTETYEVGVGNPEVPSRLFETSVPRFEIVPEVLAELTAALAGLPLWVRQRGSFGKSEALLLTTIASLP